MIRYGNFLFKYRNAIFPLAMTAVLAVFRPTYPGGSATADIWLDIAGMAIVLTGLGLRAAVIGLAYIKRGGVAKRIYAENLVTDGIFAHCRNPLYVGNLLILLGVFVIYNNPWVYLLGGGFFLVSYTAIVLAEEAFLRDKFAGAYDDYCRDVGRWWVEPRGLARTFSGMRFNWRRVIIKDYSTITTTAIMVLGLFAFEMVVNRGFDASRTSIYGFAAAAGAVLLAALAVRSLKKAHILTERMPEAAAPSA
jgi:protein-S-isoprenylcysteine O-methyltransferase Ste14